MNEKELFRQKFQAQLDEWKADIAKLKAKASGAEADVQIAINKQVEVTRAQTRRGQGEAFGACGGERRSVGFRQEGSGIRMGVHEVCRERCGFEIQGLNKGRTQ